MDAELRQLREDFSAALAASGTGIYRWDAKTGAVLAVDDNFKRLFGLHASSSSDLTGELAKRVHPDDLPAVSAAAAASRETGDYNLEYRVVLPGGDIRWLFSRGKMLRDHEGNPTVLVGACTDITARKRQEQHRELLLDELNHRVKNTLAIVQSIAMQTLRGAGVDQVRDTLESRLVALAKAHDILTAGHWSGGDLKQLVCSAVQPYAQDGRERFGFDGPDVQLRPKALLALSMALHELSTNAMKYGALSSEAGNVRIDWQVTDEVPRNFRMSWVESGGPPVAQPNRRGFGTRLIEQGLAQDIMAVVRMEFAREGLRCAIEAPLQEITGTG